MRHPLDGQKSDTLEVKAGVPQWSRLGPLLFLIYMNDISEDIESDILLFADDTFLFAFGSDPAETVDILSWLQMEYHFGIKCDFLQSFSVNSLSS